MKQALIAGARRQNPSGEGPFTSTIYPTGISRRQGALLLVLCEGFIVFRGWPRG